MATLNLVVPSGADDARNITGDSTFTATAATQHIGKFTATTVYFSGLRFTGVTIPQGATITSATLTLYCSNVNAGTTAKSLWYGNAVDNATAFANVTADKPEGKARTTASVAKDFTTANWTTVGYNAGDTVDVTTIVQEIINRGGWASGNALSLMVTDNGSASTSYIGFATYDNASTKAAKLDIVYTTSFTGTKTQTATARISKSITKTQSATARVQATVTKTQSATANIVSAGTFTKNQTATARISKSLTKTQTAIARISKSLTKTQTAVARVSKAITKTQTATARVSATRTKTQTAIARIYVPPPTAPTSLSGSQSGSQINLTWTDNSSDETGFVLERKRGGSSNYYVIATPAANATTYSDTTVDAGYTYTYRIKATKSGNDSTYATSSSISMTGTKAWTSYIQAWLYPGSPAENANEEYSDGRVLHVLKPEYYTLNSSGVLVQKTVALSGENGYSSTNSADVKAHSDHQYASVSSNFANAAVLLADSTKKSNAITTLVNFAVAEGFTGIELDWEGFAEYGATEYASYLTFVSDLGTALHAQSKKLMVDGPPITNSTEQTYYQWHYEDFESLTQVDFITVMLYDYQYDYGNPSSVQPASWAKDGVAWVRSKITDVNRIVIGLPSYGYSATDAAPYVITILTKTQASVITGYGTATRNADGEMNWNNASTFYLYQDSTGLNTKRELIEDEGVENISVWHLGGNDWFTGKTEPQFGTILTKTQTAVARIAISATKTQTATARISKSFTKTQTATARISKTFTFTQSATARVSKSLTKTQSAIARVTASVTKTQTSTARISKSLTKTQTAVARVSKTLTVTQTAIARISKTFTLTQTSIARISKSFTLTQSATARIVASVTKTQSATARITRSVTKTQSAVARISKTFTLTQGAVARVQVTSTKTQSATASILAVSTSTFTQTATARIVATVTKTQSAIARISTTLNTDTIPGNALSGNGTTGTGSGTISQASSATSAQAVTLAVWFKLNADGVNTATSQALFQYRYWYLHVRNTTNQVNFRYDETVAHVATGAVLGSGNTSWHLVIGVYTPTGGSNATMELYQDGVKTSTNQTALPTTLYNSTGYNLMTRSGAFLNGSIKRVIIYHKALTTKEASDLYLYNSIPTSPIALFELNDGTGSAIIDTSGNGQTNGTLSGAYTWGTGNAGLHRIYAQARIQATVTKNQTAIARISKSFTKTQASTARIQATGTKTQTATARISKTLTSTQTSTARIQVTSTKTQNATANIAGLSSRTFTQTATARITRTSTLTQGAIARISKTFTLTQTAISRIQASLTKTQGAIARITATRTKTQTATARITKSLTKTQGAIARIQKSFTLTQTAVSRITKTATYTQSSTARITATGVKTQSATASIITSSTFTYNQTATARITKSLTKTQTATARISKTFTKTQGATARISKSLTKTQLSTARIRITGVKTQSATARITKNFTLTQPATAKIVVTRTFTQTATASIGVGRTLTQTARAYIYVPLRFPTPDVGVSQGTIPSITVEREEIPLTVEKPVLPTLGVVREGILGLDIVRPAIPELSIVREEIPMV